MKHLRVGRALCIAMLCIPIMPFTFKISKEKQQLQSFRSVQSVPERSRLSCCAFERKSQVSGSTVSCFARGKNVNRGAGCYYSILALPEDFLKSLDIFGRGKNWLGRLQIDSKVLTFDH